MLSWQNRHPVNVANGLPIDWPKFRLTNGILAKPWGPWDGFTRGFQLKESIIYPPDIHNVCFYDKASTVAMERTQVPTVASYFFQYLQLGMVIRSF